MRIWMMLLLMAVALILPGVASSQFTDPICSDAAVFYCEDWEDWPIGNVFGNTANVNKPKRNAYGANPGTPDIIASTPGNLSFTGTKAIRMTTPGNNLDCCASGGAIDSSWVGGNRTTVFWRWYTRYSTNYIFSPVGTKHNEMYTCCFTGQHGLQNAVQDNGLFNSNANHGFPPPPIHAWLFARGGTITPQDTDFTQNRNTTSGGPFGPNRSYNVDQWYCNEVRITYNTGATSSDGYLQGWINGIQHWEYPSVRLVDIPNPVSTGPFMASYWNCDGDERCGAPGTNPHFPTDTNDYRHPTIFRYMDALVGSTARIGCIGGTTLTPPGTPSNLTVTMNWIGRLWAWLGVRPAYAGR